MIALRPERFILNVSSKDLMERRDPLAQIFEEKRGGGDVTKNGKGEASGLQAN